MSDGKWERLVEAAHAEYEVVPDPAPPTPPVGSFETKGGKSYLENLLKLNPSKRTLRAIEEIKEEDRARLAEWYDDVMNAWLEQARAQPSQWVSPTDFDSDVKYSPFDKAVYAVFDEARELLLRKHADYGPKNISGSPGGPLNGLRVRAWDKIARINNLLDSGATPENESLRDSFLDLANYALIGLLVLDGSWPE